MNIISKLEWFRMRSYTIRLKFKSIIYITDLIILFKMFYFD